ncbi:hypothetical protein GCM10007858_15360 [Bradyrhizobium liaoningense]|nr:hypothetical protein GCM10007858_15360 [Bradyrhizobium liaoningense]
MSGNRRLVNIDHQLEYKFGNQAHGRSGKGQSHQFGMTPSASGQAW